MLGQFPLVSIRRIRRLEDCFLKHGNKNDIWTVMQLVLDLAVWSLVSLCPQHTWISRHCNSRLFTAQMCGQRWNAWTFISNFNEMLPNWAQILKWSHLPLSNWGAAKRRGAWAGSAVTGTGGIWEPLYSCSGHLTASPIFSQPSSCCKQWLPWSYPLWNTGGAAELWNIHSPRTRLESSLTSNLFYWKILNDKLQASVESCERKGLNEFWNRIKADEKSQMFHFWNIFHQ